MSGPFVNGGEYVDAVATSLMTLAWGDLQPRGLVVKAAAGDIRAERTMLDAGEFALTVDEEVVDPAAGGAGHGRLTCAPYHGVLHRLPDQVAFLIDPSGRPDQPERGLEMDMRWQADPLPTPPGVDAEAWSEYGFGRATETVVVRQGRSDVAFGCLIPFHPGVLEAGIYVESSARGRGLGSLVAAELLRRLASRSLWCHWVTLAGNAASQRLAHLGRVEHEVQVSTYWWE